MQRSFGGTAFEPAEQPRDKELTLGPVLLTALAVGLVGLCAVCFFTGYAMGRHANPALTASAAPAASGPSAAQLLANPPKPTATQSGDTPQAAAQTPITADAGDGSTAAGTAAPGQPVVVQTALPAQAGSVQPAVVNDQTVHPALPQTVPGGAWMVQIAAVSHSEDADVLVSALRKRGYSVSSKHDAVDNLIHVQVGPFATHADAATMRQKLLNDGYNAIIQP